MRGGGSLSLVSKPDEFVKEEEKNGLSQKAKWGIAGGIGVGALIAFYLVKGKVSEAKKLAEHIEFKPAKTYEEAVEFGKKHLGIKNYAGFEAKDIDALNWFNEGLVNTSNKMNGRLRMPKSVCFIDSTVLGENSLAGVINQPVSKYDGYFYLNKKFFENPAKAVDDFINQAVEAGLLSKVNGKYQLDGFFSKETRQEMCRIIEEAQQTKSFNSNVKAYNAIDQAFKTFNSFDTNPMNTINVLLKNSEQKAFLEGCNLLTDMEKIKKLPFDELNTLRNDMLDFLFTHNKLSYINDIIATNKPLANKLLQKGLIKDLNHIDRMQGGKVNELFQAVAKETGYDEMKLYPIKLECELKNTSPFETLYHEMGHLQDMVPRVPACHKFGDKYDKYPQELKNWVDDAENIRIANRISPYSASGPGEFIAEVYAKLIAGQRVPDEVMALYKKMNGPVVPA